MIPLKLQVQNFMSYGERVPPLDFSGIRLACLSGDNGNGKTALLDAMTWALFGETRASAEEDVIRLGAADVRVILDFAVDAVKYRVHKGRGRRGGAVWELQIWQEDGSLRSLTGTNARETKAKIEQILRMDYKTFLASGYLAQGRADEFARATVADRKKVLADILDLSRYERLEQMAKERRVEIETRETDAVREIHAIDAELANEDSYHAALENAQAILNEVTTGMDALRSEYDRIHAEVQLMEEREQKARDLEDRIVEAQDENARSQRELTEAQKRIGAAEAILSRRAQIEDAYYRFQALTERVKPLQQDYDTAMQLQRQAQTLDRAIRAEHERLDRERYRLESDIQNLETEGQDAARFEEEITRLDSEIQSYGDPEARRRDAETKRTEAENRLLKLRENHAALKAQSDAFQTRLNALCNSDAAECEYCGQPLPPERRRDAIAETEAKRDALAVKIAEMAAQGRDAKKDGDRCRAEAETAQRELSALGELKSRRALVEQHLHRIAERTKMLPEMQKRYAAYVQQLAAKEYAQKEQEELVQISARLEKLERVAEELNSVRSQLERFRDAEREHLLLQQADDVMAVEPPRVAEIQTLMTKRDDKIAKARKIIIETRTKTANLPEIRRQQDNLAFRLKEAQESARAAEQDIGRYRGRLDHCAKLRGEREIREKERLAAASEKDLYKELIGAFGKKGVQALIIGNALPELQNQANDLLGRMTSGGMSLQLVLQREAKTKGGPPIETLDIIIADEMGTRPYEMFSGGEAFRINFALRVALSKLLARRAGAPLQTLILDEGFGTQDPRGREAITDALQSIASDFSLVLVITHIEELKEAFPTRIEVVKGQGGSTFTVA
jgi:DNA repair protein SbcC/Rad50